MKWGVKRWRIRGVYFGMGIFTVFFSTRGLSPKLVSFIAVTNSFID